jgi:hypothetical protein
MCLMFFLWFASGIVMMYVEYPELTEQERIRGLSSLDLDAGNIRVDSLEQLASSNKELLNLRVNSHLGRPVFHTQFDDGTTSVIFADNGETVQTAKKATAEAAASIFAKNSGLGGDPRYIKQLEMDQWTVYGGFNAHRPLHQVALDNSGGTILYLSNLTGQVIRDTHAWERRWNWVGSTIHWIYPMQLRKYPDIWANVVIVLSMLGIVAVASGTVIGLLRLRTTKRYRNGSVTPYEGMQKWHHLLGIAFTVFITTFVVSGMLSMNPFGIFDEKSSSAPQIDRYEGGALKLEGLKRAMDSLYLRDAELEGVKELLWQQINGYGVLIARTDSGPFVLNLSSSEIAIRIKETLPLLLPNHALTELERLESFDNYYYSTHNRYRPLPVYRARFNDEESTWYYIDADTGEILFRSTTISRIERWLYNGLHSLDFQFLLANRPLWDIVVLLLSVAGIAASYTSIVIAWRRLNKTKSIRFLKARGL